MLTRIYITPEQEEALVYLSEREFPLEYYEDEYNLDKPEIAALHTLKKDELARMLYEKHSYEVVPHEIAAGDFVTLLKSYTLDNYSTPVILAAGRGFKVTKVKPNHLNVPCCVVSDGNMIPSSFLRLSTVEEIVKIMHPHQWVKLNREKQKEKAEEPEDMSCPL